MDEDDDGNQLVLSKKMFDPAYEADTFPAKILQMLAENIRHLA